MKLITLNTWGGRAGKEKLLSFFEKYKGSIDIFCLQEIWSAPYQHHEGNMAGGKEINHEEIMVYGLQEISKLLSEHTPYFRPHHGDHYGLLMFVKKDIDVVEEGETFVFRHKGFMPTGDVGNHARNIQDIEVEIGKKSLTVINFHGLWTGKGKNDNEDRINQSKNILEFIGKVHGDLILCGDFNLLPNTESIKIIENSGLKNLIKEYSVTSTRTSYYTKPEKFADYVFVSKGVSVKDFKVLSDEVSDHSALYLDFTI